MIPGEAGHCGISPLTKDDYAVFDLVLEESPECRFGSFYRIEAEALLSGVAIPRVYKAILSVDGLEKRELSTKDIFDRARTGSDAHAHKTIAFFKRYLAQLAGDLAITFTADGGVFIAGGVAMANPWIFDKEFLKAFNQGGTLSSLRAANAVYLVQNSELGLVGAMRAAESLF